MSDGTKEYDDEFFESVECSSQAFKDDEPQEQPQEQRWEESNKTKEHGRFYERLMNAPYLGSTVRRFPRCCVLIFGVVLPLFSLILVSLFFGCILAHLEAPNEVQTNDASLAKEERALLAANLLAELVVAIPTVCLESYVLDNWNTTTVDKDFVLNLTVKEALENEVLETPQIPNATDLYLHMRNCGGKFSNFTRGQIQEVADAFENDDTTFNWIRCHRGARDLKLDLSGDLSPHEQDTYATQHSFYAGAWAEDVHQKFLHYLEHLEASHYSDIQNVLNQAMDEATGGGQCYLNGAGSAWFWFTILTTIGYGNQSPETPAGKALVFTAGFFCILAFGAILAMSGYIVMRLWDETCLARPYLRFLSRPFWACLFWGGLWGSWMLVIAQVTVWWKHERARHGSDDISFGDAYWFSYISTTTVGLGDFYLEPEAITGVDLIYFPMLFLVGFTFLSAFLGKFSSLIVDIMSGDKLALVDSILIQHTMTNGGDSEEEAKAAEAQECAP